MNSNSFIEYMSQMNLDNKLAYLYQIYAIMDIYKDFFLLLDETIDKNFTDKYKIFIDEYEEECGKIKNILEVD